MKRFTATTVATLTLAAFSAAPAMAGGLDRSGQGIDILFEQGNAFSMGMSYVTPTLQAATPALTGNIADPYTSFSFGFKYAVNDKVDLALVVDQPYGANISYKGAMTGAANAQVSAAAFTALARYHVTENISVHGGLRLQSITANVSLPPVGSYVLDMSSDVGVGYVVGAAYEIPEIALRAAITYNSAITQTLTGTEGVGGGVASSFAQQTPQSLNFDFQTGIAENTLLMASARWVNWSAFNISPPGFPANPLTSYSGDTISYEVGLGRKLSDAFSVAATIGYEAPLGAVASDLGPNDGYWSFGLGGSWQVAENAKLSGGVRYIALGDANGGALTGGTAFTGNHAVGFGLSLTTSF